MPTTIDDRVVRMEFDNAQFERNVRKSMSTIDDLKRKLDFSASADSFNELERTSRNVKFEELTQNIDKISNKISGWGVVAKTVIENITNQALSSAKKVAEAFSTAPMAEGWKQYEARAGYISSMLSAIKDDLFYIYDEEGKIITDKNGDAMVDTAKKLEYVYENLERVLWYADETSADVNSMIKGATTYINSGFDLDKAQEIMMGINNWAYSLGRTGADAAAVIEQLGQAASKGYIQVNDWYSVENRNMSNAKINQQIIDAAVAMEKLVKIEQEDGTYKYYINKEMDEATGELKKYRNGIELTTGAMFDYENATEVTAQNMRNTLNERWFTNDVLAEFTKRYGNFSSELSKIVQEANTKYGLDKGLLATNWMDYVEEYTATAADDEKARQEIIQRAADEAEYTFEDMQRYLDLLSGPEYTYGEAMMRKSQETKTFTEAIEATKKAAASAWTEIYQLIFGDYQKATGLFSTLVEDLYTFFVEPIKELQAGVKKWAPIGFKMLWGEEGAYKNIIASVNAIFGSDGIIRKAYEAIFGEISDDSIAEALLNLTQKIKEFTASLIPTEETTKRLSKIFEGFFSLLDIGKHILAGIKIALEPVFDFLKDIFGVLFNVTETGAGWISNLRDIIVENETFENIGRSVAKVLTSIFDVIRGLAASIKDVGVFKTFDQLLQNIISGVTTLFSKDATDNTSEFLQFASKVLDTIASVLRIIYKIAAKLIGLVQNFFSNIEKKLNEAESDSYLAVIWEFLKRIGEEFVDRFIPSVERLREVLNAIHIEQVLASIKKLAMCFMVSAPLILGMVAVIKLLTTIENIIWGIGGMISPFMGLNAMFGSLSDVFDQIKSNLQINIVQRIASAALMFAGALFIVVMSIKFLADQLVENRTATSEAFNMIIEYIMIMVIAEEILAKSMKDPAELKALNTGIKAFVSMTLSLVGIAIAINMIAKYPCQQVLAATLSLVGVVVVLMGVMSLLSKAKSIDPAKMKKMAASISVMTIGIIGIAVAIRIIAGYSWDELLPAVISLSGVIIVLTGVMAFLGSMKAVNPSKTKKIASALSGMVLGLLGVALAIRLLAGYSWDQLLPAVVSLAGVIIVLTSAMAVISSVKKANPSKIKQIARSITLMTVGVLGIAASLRLLAGYSWDQLLPAAVMLTGVIVVLASVFAVISSFKETSALGMIGAAAAIAILAGSMVIFAGALAILSKLDWDKLQVGVVFLGGLVTILGLLAAILGHLGGASVIGAASIAIIAGAVLIMAVSFQMLEKSLTNLMKVVDPKGMLKIAGAFVIIAAASAIILALLAGIGPGVLVVAAALAITILSIAYSLKLCADAIETMANLSDEGIKKIAPAFKELGKGIGQMIVEIVRGVKDAIPEIFAVVRAFFTEIALFLPAWIWETTEALLDALNEHLPKIMDKIKALVKTISDWIKADSEGDETCAGMIIEAVLALLKILGGYQRKIVGEIVQFMINVINALAAVIRAESDNIVTAIDGLIGAFMGLALKLLDAVASKFGIHLWDGLSDGFEEKYWTEGGLQKLLTDLKDRISVGIKDILFGKGTIARAIDDALSAVVEWVQKKLLFQSTDGLGLADYVKRAWDAALEEGTPKEESVFKTSDAVIEGMAKGLTYGQAKIYATGEALAKSLQNGMENDHGGLGIHSPSKVMAEIGYYAVLGLVDGLSSSSAMVEDAAEDIGVVMTTTLSKVYDTLDQEDSLDPVITPVLDLTEIQNGAGLINGMMGGYRVGASVDTAGIASSGMNSREVRETGGVVTTNTDNSTVSNSNTFYITGDDPKQIAEEVSRILQNQVGRRNSVWAQ